MNVEDLQKMALIIRRNIITMLFHAGSGHTGGSLSCTDFATVLMFRELIHNPKNPKWIDRDILLYSNGHVTPVNYSCLAEAGYFPKKDLLQFRKLSGHLQGHPSCHDTPGIEVSSGSLGQGLSIGCGVAIASKREQHRRRTYVVLGDGELQEGMIWEAAMFAGHYQLNNLCAIVDRNRKQIDGDTEEVMALEPLVEKWQSFRWHVITIDGHNISEINNAFQTAKNVNDKPTVIIAKTVMGKGVSFMENDYKWHGVAPKRDQAEKALAELGTSLDEWTNYLASH
ncbi:MAG: transketolase [bacterium]|nr:transketolase [bacterium]